MNLIADMLLALHAKIAADHREDQVHPDAKWALKTVSKTGDDSPKTEDTTHE